MEMPCDRLRHEFCLPALSFFFLPRLPPCPGKAASVIGHESRRAYVLYSNCPSAHLETASAMQERRREKEKKNDVDIVV